MQSASGGATRRYLAAAKHSNCYGKVETLLLKAQMSKRDGEHCIPQDCRTVFGPYTETLLIGGVQEEGA
jgi:hypothetical protein